MGAIDKYLGGGGTPVGGIVMFPDVVTENPITDGAQQFLRTGTVIPYDSTKHATAVQRGLGNKFEVFPSEGNAQVGKAESFLVYDPTKTGGFDLWHERVLKGATSNTTNIAQLYQSNGRGQFRLKAQVSAGEFMKHVAVLPDSGNAAASDRVYVNEIIIHPIPTSGVYVAAAIINDTQGSDYSNVVLLKSVDGAEWSLAGIAAMLLYADYYTGIGIAAVYGKVFLRFNAGQVGTLIFDINTGLIEAATNAGTTIDTSRTHYPTSDSYYLMGQAGGTIGLLWIPLESYGNRVVQNLGAVTRSYGYAHGKYYAGVDSVPQPYTSDGVALLTTRTAAGSLSTSYSYITPTRTGFLFATNGGAGAPGLFYSDTAGVVWTSACSTNGSWVNLNEQVLSDIGQNFINTYNGSASAIATTMLATASQQGRGPGSVNTATGTWVQCLEWNNAATANNRSVILRSTDKGATWTAVFASEVNGVNAAIMKIECGNGVWLILRGNGTILRSIDDGLNWTTIAAATTGFTGGGLYDGIYVSSLGKWLITGANQTGNKNAAWSSDGGQTWNMVQIGGTGNALGLATNGTRVLCWYAGSTTYYSDDLATWASTTVSGVPVWDGSKFVCFGATNPITINTSTLGGTSWTAVNHKTDMPGPYYDTTLTQYQARFWDGYYYLSSLYYSSYQVSDPMRSVDLLTWEPVPNYGKNVAGNAQARFIPFDTKMVMTVPGAVYTPPAIEFNKEGAMSIGTQKVVSETNRIGYVRTA